MRFAVLDHRDIVFYFIIKYYSIFLFDELRFEQWKGISILLYRCMKIWFAYFIVHLKFPTLLKKPIKQILWTYVLWVNAKIRVVNPSITDIIFRSQHLIIQPVDFPCFPAPPPFPYVDISLHTNTSFRKWANERSRTVTPTWWSGYFPHHFEML